MKTFNFQQATDLYLAALESRSWASFDVFDTLLRRRCDPASPVRASIRVVAEAAGISDLRTVERERWAAYGELCAEAVAAGADPETSLHALATAWTKRLGMPHLAPLAVRSELEADHSVCFGNPVLIKACRYLKGNGKRIAVISDMYLGGEAVSSLLNTSGFHGMIDGIFVSGDFSLKKKSGRLFTLVLNQLGVEPHDIAHMGDDVRADWIRPREKGMLAVLVLDMIEMFRRAQTQVEESFAVRGSLAPFLSRFLFEGRRHVSPAALLTVSLAAHCGPSRPVGQRANSISAALQGLGITQEGPPISFEEFEGARSVFGSRGVCKLSPHSIVIVEALAYLAPHREEMAEAGQLAEMYRAATRFGVGLSDLDMVINSVLLKSNISGSWKRSVYATGLTGVSLARGILRRC